MNEDMPPKKTTNKKKLVIVPKEPSPESIISANNVPSATASFITTPSISESNVSNSSSKRSSTSSSSRQSQDNHLCDVNLEKEFQKLNCSNEDYYSNECNKFLLKKELVERNCLQSDEDDFSYLYPNLNDKEFNIKIAEKKEFYDTKYDGTIYEDIAKHADVLSKADYELQPHQAFVKNFMSFQTPYNSLLLYHGLGSGKTCSAIGVCEEMRDYMKQMGIHKRIIVVASENVQDNFKIQLFEERKLKLVDGLWNIQSCTGNKLLKEINPMSMKGIPKEKVISQIKTIINTYYMFMGYGQFANYIIKTMNYQEEMERTREKNKGVPSKKEEPIVLNKRVIQRLRNEFNNRLIVIDEIHNIRKSDDNENKKVAIYLEFLVKSAQNMRFLFLSATPMYNNYKEIIWLLNLMNMNDRRGRIDVKDVFDKNGHFKKNGKEMLIRKATGYISFVRGENPYTFPYRTYPNEFAKEHTFPFISYPSYQMNLKKIKPEDKNRILSLYLNTIGNCQQCGECQGCIYQYIIHALRNKEFTITTKKGEVREMPSFENMESFGYTMLQVPIESLIISYPDERLKQFIQDIPREKYSDVYSPSFSELEEKEGSENNADVVSVANATIVLGGAGANDEIALHPSRQNLFVDSNELTGKRGLDRMMTYVDTKSPQEKGQFEYKKTTVEKYGRLFQRDIIGKYSSKIKCILEQIYNEQTGLVSEGVVLIYSQYIDSGLIPMALALEEMGFTRYGQNAKSLFKQKPCEVVDVRTMKPRSEEKDGPFIPARYSIITGDPRISPNNDYEVKGLTDEENKTGAKVKVVLISRAGSEGIDLKFIRQVHILDPWYNMNRIEQIIGRAVRNFSHKSLPFEKRNVEIYMHGTILGKENKEEAADLYVYRVAEYKAIQIGKVSRILKETAVDCIIHHDQTNFTQEKISEMLKKPVRQVLSNGYVLNDFKIGDAPFSPACDYMASCNYECVPNKVIGEDDLNEDTYNEAFIVNNSEKILQKIRLLMKESYFYKKEVLFLAIQTPKKYPYVQIYSALTQLIEDNNEFIADKYGRNGRLVNIGEYYLFQPVELQDKNISIFDRMVPIDYKHASVQFEINKQMGKEKKKDEEREKEGEGEGDQHTEGKKVFEELKTNMNTVITFSKETKVVRGEEDWYKYGGIVMKKMKKDFPEITEEKMLRILTAHMIELLLFDEKMDLMKYVYSLNTIEKNSLVWYLKEYFERNSIVTKNFHAIVLYNLNKRMIFLLNGKNTWTEAEPEDEIEIASSKEAKQFFASLEKKNYNKIVGFIGYEKKNRFLVFKTKNMTSTRDTGARCDEAGKNKTLNLLNEIIGEDKYTNENTKLKKDSDGNVIQEPMNQIELCVLQEIILRYYDDIQKDGKSWFFTPEMAIYYKLYKILQ